MKIVDTPQSTAVPLIASTSTSDSNAMKAVRMVSQAMAPRNPKTSSSSSSSSPSCPVNKCLCVLSWKTKYSAYLPTADQP